MAKQHLYLTAPTITGWSPNAFTSTFVLRGYVTDGFLQKLFGRKPLTLTLWRKHRRLPHVLIPGDKRPTLRYVLTDVMAWATHHGIKTHRVPKIKVAKTA